ncbi:MAG: glycosyltransferase family 4 protein [Promethearchaeota archaeon]
MEKLKICHVSLTVFPDRKDGAAKFQRGIFNELKARGHDIILLTAKWGEGFKDPNIISINVPNSRFLWLPKFGLKFSRFLKKNNFDIIQ